MSSSTEGDRAVRGGLLRVGGYGVGLLATGVSTLVLARHLGVVDFGRFVTVIALVAIIGGLSDAGLTVTGQRRYVESVHPEQRRSLLALLLGLRLAITPPAVALATLFAVAAGYDSTMIAGTAIAGAGLVFSNAAMTLVTPSVAELKMGPTTVVDVARQLAIALGIVLCAALGTSLGPFFWVYAGAGAVTLLVGVAAAGRSGRTLPRFDRTRWAQLAREAAPLAAGLAINVVYVRVLVLLTSIVGTERETGLFGASARLLEVLTAIPALMTGAAFPILVAAGRDEEERLGYGLQRLAEASLLVAVLLVVPLVIAAEPVMRLFGGEDFEGAASVLALQAGALIGAFLTQVWALGLLAVHRDRALLTVNACGLAVALLLGLTLIPPLGADGAAIAAVAGELALAATALALLRRARPGAGADLIRLARPLVALAAGLGAGFALLALGLPAAGAGALAFLLAAGTAFAVGAVPGELLQALRSAPFLSDGRR